MFSFLYELVLIVVFLLSTPWFLYQIIVKKKYRKSFFQRFGWGFPKIEKKGPLLWMHAVSVGEVRAIKELAKKLQKEFSQKPTLVISTTTETGYATAKEILPFADYHVFMPFDFFLVIRRIVKQVSPDMVICSETDLWWRFLSECKKQGAVISVINGKVSERSFERLKRFPFYTKRVYDLVDLFCAQSQEFHDRYTILGVPQSKVVVTGNIKSDTPFEAISQKEKEEMLSRLHAKEGDFFLVIGSTHSPEEEEIFSEMQPFLQNNPSVRLIIVPRHPDRFNEVAAKLRSMNADVLLWSDLIEQKKRSQVVVVNAMGILTKLYQIADVVIVAGSFVERVGGHNILESFICGKPTIVGPYMQGQKIMLDEALKHDALRQVKIEELSETIEEIMKDPVVQQKMAQNAVRCADSMRGATDKTVELLHKKFPSVFTQ